MNSVKNRNWDAPPRADVSDESKFVPHVSAVAIEIALNRAITKLNHFFYPSPAALHHPFDLENMQVAVTQILTAVDQNQKIGIVGDYDCDGATSTALMLRYFRMLKYDNVIFRIPHRMHEGYGFSRKIVEEMAAEGVQLILVLDSGTSALDAVQATKDHDIPCVIVDHHEAGATLPDVTLVNPKQDPDNRSLDYLCTAGLTFLLIGGINLCLQNKKRRIAKNRNAVNITPLMGLAALGTICDVVPLVGMNRIFVAHGLKFLEKMPFIRSLYAKAKRQSDTVSVGDCGFFIGPTINAAGRLDQMTPGVEMLASDDRKQCDALAEQLLALNSERKAMQREALTEARQMALDQIKRDPQSNAVLVIYSEAWHPGIVGLVASRLKDEFDRPCVIIGEGGKGSCRSIEGFDIGHAIIAASANQIIVKGGGHAMAAGLTVNDDQIAGLRQHLVTEFSKITRPPLKADLCLQADQVSVELIKAFEPLAPFGQGNPNPRLIIYGGTVVEVKETKTGGHIYGVIRQGDTDLRVFIPDGQENKIGQYFHSSRDRQVDVLCTAKVDEFAGREQITLTIEDIRYLKQDDIDAATRKRKAYWMVNNHLNKLNSEKSRAA